MSYDPGLSGGIMKLPSDCQREDQKMGVGMTVYYFSESIEKVPSSLHYQNPLIFCDMAKSWSLERFANFEALD